MSLQDLLGSIGLNSEVFVAGAMGGVLRALSRRRYKLREMVASPICGALAAAYLTLPTVRYADALGLRLPGDDPQLILALAFCTGTCAMWISDVIFEFVVRRFVRREE